VCTNVTDDRIACSKRILPQNAMQSNASPVLWVEDADEQLTALTEPILLARDEKVKLVPPPGITADGLGSCCGSCCCCWAVSSFSSCSKSAIVPAVNTDTSQCQEKSKIIVTTMCTHGPLDAKQTNATIQQSTQDVIYLPSAIYCEYIISFCVFCWLHVF